jgi:hypothetical protein
MTVAYQYIDNFAFAGLVSGRDPFYLPYTTRPTGGVGYNRNLTLNQSPFSTQTFLTGIPTVKITPLQLSGKYFGLSEEEARIWGGQLEEAIGQWTGLQRSANVTRVLLPGGSVIWDTPDAPHERPFTLTLYPAGPAWLDGTGIQVPF